MPATGLAVDRALSSIGRYNVRRILLTTIHTLTYLGVPCSQIMIIVFIGLAPDHHCKVNNTTYLNESIPLIVNEGVREWSKCYKYNGTNVTIACGEEGWDYDIEKGHSTIVTEWDLVCGKEFLPGFSQSMFFIGSMLASLIAAPMADRYGRKWVYLISLWSVGIFGIIIAFSPSIEFFLVLRLIVGFARELVITISSVMLCELFPSSERAAVMQITSLSWSVGWFLLGLFAYLIRNWRHLQIVITAPIALSVGFIWVLPESIPWMEANNKRKETLSVLHMFNRKKTKEEFEQILTSKETAVTIKNTDKDVNVELKEAFVITTERNNDDRVTDDSKFIVNEETEVNYNWCDICRNKVLRIQTVITVLNWVANTLVFHVLSLMSTTLAGDKYVNFIISGLVEIPAFLFAGYVMTKFGRRLPFVISMVICGALLLAGCFIPKNSSVWVLTVVIAMAAKLVITFSFGIIWLYVTELYPTNLRNAGFGLNAFLGRLGGVLAPLFLLLAKVRFWIPGLICGIFTIVAGLLALLLPETLGRPLPVTTRDVEKISRFKNKKVASTEHLARTNK